MRDRRATYLDEVEQRVVLDLDESVVEPLERVVGVGDPVVVLVVGEVLVDVHDDEGEDGAGDVGERDQLGFAVLLHHPLDYR